MLTSNLEIQHQNHIIGVNSCQKQKIFHNVIKTQFYLQKDKEDAQSERSGGTGEEEEGEEDRSESWTLIEWGLEELEEGAKKIIQGIENLKTGLKNMSKTLEEKK